MLELYRKLRAGETRRAGDEKRRTQTFGEFHDSASIYLNSFRRSHANEFQWHLCNLVGHVILGADLIGFEFRRLK